MMPVHDWTKVVAGNFHDFHQRWNTNLGDALNEDVLPDDFYALVEPKVPVIEPDVVALAFDDAGERSAGSSDGLIAVADAPPAVRFTEAAEVDYYASRADRIAIRRSNGDRVVAFIEVLSPGNKDRGARLSQFLDKCDEGLDAGCHLLLVDLHPPGTHDPEGIHHALWTRRGVGTAGVTVEEPVGLSSYRAEPVGGSIVPTAYFERVAFGNALPDMPLFLTPDHYVNTPLERTYERTWAPIKKRWKRRIIDSQENE